MPYGGMPMPRQQWDRMMNPLQRGGNALFDLLQSAIGQGQVNNAMYGGTPVPTQSMPMPARGPMSQAPKPMPGPSDASGGVQNLIEQFGREQLAKEHEKAKKKAETLFQKANEMMMQAQQLQPPKPQQPVGYRDALPMLGIGLLAKLLGATDRDLAEGGAGFLQGRGQWAQGQNDYNQQAWQHQQRGLMGQAEMAQREFGIAKEDADRLQSREWQLDDRAYTEGVNAKNAGILEGRDLVNRWLQANTADEKALVGSKLVQRGEMTQPEVDAAVKAMRDDKRNANRDRIYKAAMPYVTSDEERSKLTNWLVNMTDEQLELTAGRSDAEKAQVALAALRGSQKKKVDTETEFLSKTMKDRIASIATKKGLDARKLEILEKDLHYYEADRQVQVALIRARTLAAGRSNAEGMSPTEKRMQTTTIANSTEELLKENMRAIRVALGNPKNAEGKELTDEELEVAIESPQNLPALVGAASTAALWAERKALRAQRSKALTVLSQLNGQQPAGKQQKPSTTPATDPKQTKARAERLLRDANAAIRRAPSKAKEIKADLDRELAKLGYKAQ